MSLFRLTGSKWWTAILLLWLLTLPTWTPLTHSGFPATTTGPLPVLNLHAVERGAYPALAQPLDRWRTDGFWSYRVASIGRLLGLDATPALKSSVVIALLLLGAGTLGWGWRLLGWQGSLAAALLVGYATPLLSAIYQKGDVALPWALVGLSWGAWGVVNGGSWSFLLIILGMIMAWNALPGLGLWISLALFLLALGIRNKKGVVTVLVGTVVSFLPTAPWTRPLLSSATADGVAIYQLIEPAWPWQTGQLSPTLPLSASLGVPLLGLLLLGLWRLFPLDSSSSQVAESEGTILNGKLKRVWLVHLAVGGMLLLLSLQVVSQHLPFVLRTVRTPWYFLLLSIPFLAMAAMLGFKQLLTGLPTSLWAALFLVIMLSAGPALSPTFTSYDIPPTPTAIFADGQVMLLQIRSEGKLTPGGSFALDVEWVALQKPDFDYNVFVHVVDAQGNKVAQLDTQPQQGARPMSSWYQGEMIPDRYEITLPADAPGDLHVQLGLYNWQNGARLSVGGQDYLEVPVP
ncbi:MAG: hypothetical protein GXP38_05260 [Chloroflexi bacterium]|nr:hypothetical protein [Chloroflexota bacterium]